MASDQKDVNQCLEPIKLGFLSQRYIEYYRMILVPAQMNEEEFNHMIEIYKTPLPIVFRLSNRAEHLRGELESQISNLRALGTEANLITSLPSDIGSVYRVKLDKGALRRDPNYVNFRNWLKIHCQLGHCHRQEFVSMIPPHFLDVMPDSSVLDTCASPGSKTCQILEMLGENGFVIGNDTDPRRANLLVHQLQIVGTKNAMVICDAAQTFKSLEGIQFDRVLCDVPCTGDGTPRKNPTAASRWSTVGGPSLHGLQRKILTRGLELTKPGGICVYSTCSMNPIEDEAVINSVLLDTKGAVEIADVSQKYTELKRKNGLEEWTIYDIHDGNTYKYSSYPEVPKERRQFATQTMFSEPKVAGLKNCMRFYPQFEDSGGFFVAVLRKVSEFERISKPGEKGGKKLRETPFTPFENAAPQSVAELKRLFGLGEDFHTDQLFVRDEKKISDIYFLCKPISELVRRLTSERLQTISTGVRVFTWKHFGSEMGNLPYPAQDGIEEVMKYATKRKFSLLPEEMQKLLRSGHESLPLKELSDESRRQFEECEASGAIFYIKDSPFHYGGMTLKASIAAYVRKDIAPLELKKLCYFYPSLPKQEEDASEESED